MPFLVGVVGILDSGGIRVDRPDVNGDYLPILLKLGTGLAGSSDVGQDGLTTVTVAASGAGSGALALGTHDDFRTGAAPADKQVVTFQTPPGIYVYATGSGAGIVDDDIRTLKRNATSLGSNGRLFQVRPTQTFDTMAAFRASTPNYEIAILRGGLAAGDAGRGVFLLDFSDTTTVDNTGLCVVIGGKRYKRDFNGYEVNGEWWGMRPNDAAFNNKTAHTACMAAAAGNYVACNGPGTFYFAPIAAVVNGVGGDSCIVPPHNTTLRGVPGKTKFKCMTRGLLDPTTNWETYAPVLTPMLRNTSYGLNEIRFVNGHSYRARVHLGVTAGSVPPGLTGFFPGTVADGTQAWEVADLIWRGYGINVDGKHNVVLEDLEVDMSGPREDGLYPMSGTIPPLMTGRYTDVNAGTGWDSSHKAVFGNGVVEYFRATRCWFHSCRGENVYIGGDTTPIFIDDCDISDGNADGISSTATLTVTNTRIWHVSQAVESFGHSLPEVYDHVRVWDCHEGIILGASAAGIDHPARQYVHHCDINAYHVGIWGIGFGQYFENFEFTHNVITDAQSSIFLEGFGTGIRNGLVADNTIVCDQRGIISGMVIAADLACADIEFRNNVEVRTPFAVTNGHAFAESVQSSITSTSSSRIRFINNRLKGGINSGGSANYSGYMGLWRDNVYDFTSAQDVQQIAPGGTVFYPHNEFAYPSSTSGSAVGNVTSIPTTLTEAGQIVRVALNGNAPILFPASSAGHKFPAVRLAQQNVDFRIKFDGVLWTQERYISTLTGIEPEADVIAPFFQLVNSDAPAINMWGVHITHLTPSVGTDFNGFTQVVDENIAQVYFNNHTQFRHNTGALAIKLILIGGVDFLPGASGETAFFVDAGNGIAIELVGRRIVGGVVSTGLVPTTRQIIAGAGLMGGGDLTADRTLDVVAADGTITVNANSIEATGDFNSKVIQTVQTVKCLQVQGQAGSTDTFVLGTALSWGEHASTTGARRKWIGQNAHTTSGGNGGASAWCGGGQDTGGLRGAAQLVLGDITNAHNGVGVEIAEVVATQRVVALCKLAPLTATQMPANTGDGVIFLNFAVTNPTANSAGGSIPYADGTDGGTKIRGPGGTTTTIAPS